MPIRENLFFITAILLAAACGSREKTAPPPAMTPPVDLSANAAADAGTAEAEWKLLIDLDALPPPPAVAKAETFAKLVGSMFKVFRKSKKDCTGKGDAVLVIDGATEGAFTKKDAKEMLYLVNIVPCDDKTPATHTLLIMQGGKALVNERIEEHDVVEVKDLDMDGDNEILLLGGWAPQTKARLVDTEDGKFETLFDFGEIAKGSCEGGTASGESAVVKYRKSAASMEYKAEKRPKTCPAGK